MLLAGFAGVLPIVHHVLVVRFCGTLMLAETMQLVVLMETANCHCSCPTLALQLFYTIAGQCKFAVYMIGLCDAVWAVGFMLMGYVCSGSTHAFRHVCIACRLMHYTIGAGTSYIARRCDIL